MNRFVDASIKSELKVRPGAVKKTEIEDKLYSTNEGKIYVPWNYLKNMLTNAAKSIKIPNQGKATYSKLFGSSIEITPFELILSPQDYEQFTTSAVNPMTGGRMMVTRPMFRKWALELQIGFDEDDIPVSVMNEALDRGGKYVGIGDWRPETKGVYGKFIVAEFKQIKG